MVFLRRFYRIVAIILWSVIVGLWSVPYQLRGGWKDLRRIADLVHLWNSGVATIIGMQLSTSGVLPSKGKGVVVSNHLSYMDIVAYGSVLPFRYAPKVEISRWPVLGWYIGLSRPVWTCRRSRQASRKTLRELVKTVNHGISIIVFPEGTSTDGKNGILPFKSTSFEAAIMANTTVFPALIRYRQKGGEPTVCWYGDMTLLPHAWRVLGMKSIFVELDFLKPVLPGSMPRKDLAASVHRVMAAEYKES